MAPYRHLPGHCILSLQSAINSPQRRTTKGALIVKTGLTASINWSVLFMGIVAALLVGFVPTGRKFPFITTDRAALITLLFIGMAICTVGIGRVAELNAWAHPLAILAYIVGAAILVIGVAAVLGRPVPFIGSYQQAIIVVSVMMVAKIVLTAIHGFTASGGQ